MIIIIVTIIRILFFISHKNYAAKFHCVSPKKFFSFDKIFPVNFQNHWHMFFLFSFLLFFFFFFFIDRWNNFFSLTIGTSISFFLKMNSIVRIDSLYVSKLIRTHTYIHTRRSSRDLILANISPSSRSFDKENKKNDDVYIIIN